MLSMAIWPTSFVILHSILRWLEEAFQHCYGITAHMAALQEKTEIQASDYSLYQSSITLRNHNAKK